MNSIEAKSKMLGKIKECKGKVQELQLELRQATPMATQLQVFAEIEKLHKQLDKVQYSIQELAL